MSKISSSPHLGPALGALALVVALVALVVTPARGDPDPDLSHRIVYVSNVTDKDDIDDKEIRADCPRHTLLIGGGSAIQHGNESSSVATYQGYPVDNGWEVQAHETDPEEENRFPRGQDRACRRLAFAMLPPVTRDFTWRDGERIVRFGRGALADAGDLLDGGYALLTTPRAAASAPAVVAGAAAVHHVPTGRVDEVAGDLLEEVEGDLLVALGGGRVVDVAKALAAARGAAAAAIPTTLSAAEMTRGHRHARGVDPATPRVRPRIVLNDPALSASQPDHELAASAANALGHAIEGTLTPRASPVPVLAAREAARLIAHEDDRDALALGALLSGYVIDATGYGLHHVLAQTLARFAGVWHGHANAAMLPHTTVALRRRGPDVLAALDDAAGVAMEALARRLAHHAGARQLRDLGVTEDVLETCVREALKRPDLEGTPPAAAEAEVRALYEAAY